MKAKKIHRNLNAFPKYEDALQRDLKNKTQASLYLQAALSDYAKEDDMGCLLLAIRDVVKAQGGMAILAKKTKLGRESLYKALSDSGNPQFSTLWAILHAIGFHFSIELIDKAA